MTTRLRGARARLALIALTAILCAPVAAAQVLVESLDDSSTARAAGLRPGDRLIAWERLSATGAIVTGGRFADPFDARTFEIEQFPRGPVRIHVRRAGAPLVFLVAPGFWGVAPGLSLQDPELQRGFEEGLARARARDPDRALAVWQRLIADLVNRRQARAAIWLRCRAAKMLIDPATTGDHFWIYGGNRINQSDALFEDARRSARSLGDPRLEALVDEATGATWLQDLPFDPTVEIGARATGGRIRPPLERAYRARERLAPGSLLAAASAQALGRAWESNDDMKRPPDVRRARDLYAQAATIRRRVAPGSYDDAVSRYRLAVLTLDHRLARTLAERQRRLTDLRRAMEWLGRTFAGTTGLGYVALHAGYAAQFAHEPSDARRYLGVAVAVRERLGADYKPENCGPCLDTVEILNSIGLSFLDEWRIADGERVLEQALSLTPRGSIERAMLVWNLAWAAAMKGDHAAEQRLLLDLIDDARAPRETENEGEYRRRRSLELKRLGDAARRSGNTAAGASFYRSAMTLAQGLSLPDPGNRTELREMACHALAGLIEDGEAAAAEVTRLDAECGDWDNPKALSRVALARGHTRRAVQFAAAAVAAARRGSPQYGTLPERIGSSLLHLGRAQCAAGDETIALATLSEARRIFERHAPRAPEYVEVLRALGECEAARGRPGAAADALQRAVTVLATFPSDQLERRLGGAWAAAQSAAIHASLAGALADLGRPADAFVALERGRARTLSAWVAGRGRSTDAPRARHERLGTLWVEYDRVQAALQRTPAPREAARLLAELQAIALRMDAVEHEGGRPAPGEAAARHSVTPTLGRIQRSLSPSTVLVEYSVQPQRTLVFIVEPSGPVRAQPLALESRELQALVARHRQAIERGRAAGSTAAEQYGRELYNAILRPVQDALGGHARVVIVPDGPLNDLPFAALVPTAPEAPLEYLVERTPLHVATSATGYALLAERTRAPAAGPVVAVGGALSPPTQEGGPERVPVAMSRSGEDLDLDGLPGDTTEEAATHDAAERGGTSALPGSRREAEAIARLFAPGATLLLGQDASELRVKELAHSARILHFATHATINRRQPLNAGLRLSAPPGDPSKPAPDNGLLQAWEIMQQFELKADLVTLSACESGSGRVLAGEGALSLARAFHHAGARSVLSALWSIDDRATTTLMTRFYAGLKAGLPKDEALRRAQTSFIKARGTDARWASAFFWAAFELSGDWR